MAVANTTYLRVYVDGAVVNCETSSSLSASRGSESIVCKDSAENPTVSPTEVTWSISGSAWIEMGGAGTSADDLMDALLGGTQVALSYNNTGDSGGSVAARTGNGYVTECTFNSDGTESQATVDFTITGDGELT